MAYVTTVAPALEPVTRDEAKQFARIDLDVTDDDWLIDMLISQARRHAEAYTGRSFITQQWRYVADAFPGYSAFGGAPFGMTYSLPAVAFEIEKGPVVSIDSIKYLDGGVLKTVDPSVYVTDLTGPIARVTPVFGQIWPVISTPQIGNVQVNFTAGYGDTAEAVPEGIRHWILMQAATLYENRELVAILNRGKVEDLPFVSSLLDPYVVAMV